MAWFKTMTRIGRRMFGGTPVYDGIGGGRRALAWMPSNPGAVSALSMAQDELRAKSRDLVRRNAWAAAGIEAFVANAIGTGIKPQSMVQDQANLTAAINLVPNRYGRLESLNLFPAKPTRFRQIIIEERNGVLNLLPTMPPGSPGTVGTRGKRKVRSFVIPHIPHDDVVLPEEVQGIRAFGSETELETLAGVLARHLETMRNKHAITLEHLRMGALKGEILDADGSTIYNLYDEFKIGATTMSLGLADAKANIRNKCVKVLGEMEKALQGEFMTGVRCLCSPSFFEALTSHANVLDSYSRFQEGAWLREDVRTGFTYGGITFEEYRGQASSADGTVRKFIADGEAHCFPVGTVDTFGTYFAPADFNETVNTLGQPLYAKQAPRQFERGTDLHTQSNPLPMCHRPGVLIKLTA